MFTLPYGNTPNCKPQQQKNKKTIVLEGMSHPEASSPTKLKQTADTNCFV